MQDTQDTLQALFLDESWRDQFAYLSDTFGFFLTIVSASGIPLFLPAGSNPPCREYCLSAPELQSRCEVHAHPVFVNSVATGKPAVFKCYSKIMCFALPITYMDEQAVILGQGSFSSYEDFRECVGLVQSVGRGAISIKAPLSFTSEQQAWKVCGFVKKTVNGLLLQIQETNSLRRKFESLKTVIGMWGASAEEHPESLYANLIGRLSSMLDIDCIAILMHDPSRKKYMSLSNMMQKCGTSEVFSINEDDIVVRELSTGQAFVLSADPVTDPRADFLHGMGALYFFPVMVNRKLDAILRIDDKVLKDADRHVITAFCRQVALSIENRRLQQELYNKIDQLSDMSELTKSMSLIQDYEKLLQTILDTSANLIKAERGSLMLIDQATDALLLEVKKGIIDGVTEKHRINRGEGIAGKVAQSGEAILVENLELDPRILQTNRQHYKTRSFVSIPLKIDDRIIGVLNLSDKDSGEVFNTEDLKLIQSFATHATVVMERNMFISKTEELKKLTITDSLTGLLNRRYLQERLEDELTRSARHGHTFGIFMVDIDGFKQYNDTLGHPVGDSILRVVADTVLSAVRSIDIVARYGGDEFMVILPETVKSVALDIAERIRINVSQQDVRVTTDSGPRSHTITTSIGIACYPEHGETVEELLENVDKALYRAKNEGKNRVEEFTKHAI